MQGPTGRDVVVVAVVFDHHHLPAEARARERERRGQGRGEGGGERAGEGGRGRERRARVTGNRSGCECFWGGADSKEPGDVGMRCVCDRACVRAIYLSIDRSIDR